jgi:hypothetical protein
MWFVVMKFADANNNHRIIMSPRDVLTIGVAKLMDTNSEISKPTPDSKIRTVACCVGKKRYKVRVSIVWFGQHAAQNF